MEHDGQRPHRVQPGQQRCRGRQRGEDQQEPQRGQGQLDQGAHRARFRAAQQQRDRHDRPQGEDGGDRPEQPGEPPAQPRPVADSAGLRRQPAAGGDITADQEEHREGLERPGERRQAGQVLQGARGVQLGTRTGRHDQRRDQPVAQHHTEDRPRPQRVDRTVPLRRGGLVDPPGRGGHPGRQARRRRPAGPAADGRPGRGGRRRAGCVADPPGHRAPPSTVNSVPRTMRARWVRQAEPGAK